MGILCPSPDRAVILVTVTCGWLMGNCTVSLNCALHTVFLLDLVLLH